MTFRLKDKELQAKLDEISNGEFTKALNEIPECELEYNQGLNVVFGKLHESSIYYRRFSAHFDDFEIERLSEYNPYAWNNYPQIMPSEDELMRLEFDDGFLTCGKYDTTKKAWFDTKGRPFPDAFIVKRFRPWDD